MYFCSKCGNGKKFRITVQVEALFESMRGFQPMQVELDESALLHGASCSTCGTSDYVFNLNKVTPRKVLDNLVARHFKNVGCPIKAAAEAKKWFISKSPHLRVWIEDGVPGEILVGRGSIGTAPVRQPTPSSHGIYAFFISQ